MRKVCLPLSEGGGGLRGRVGARGLVLCYWFSLYLCDYWLGEESVPRERSAILFPSRAVIFAWASPARLPLV